jgi:hypothetical protein
LPHGRRGALYPSSRTLTPHVGPGSSREGSWRSWEPPRGAARPAMGPQRRPHRRSRRSGSHFLSGFVVGTLTTCLLAIGTYVYLTKTSRIAWPAPGAQVLSRVVPTGHVVDPQGLVEVICQPVAGGAGYSFLAQPGQTVICNNGATPSF